MASFDQLIVHIRNIVYILVLVLAVFYLVVVFVDSTRSALVGGILAVAVLLNALLNVKYRRVDLSSCKEFIQRIRRNGNQEVSRGDDS